MIFDTRLARENWESKYRFKDETPLETFQRVAREVAEVELEYSDSNDEVDVDYWYDKFLKTLVDFEEISSSEFKDLSEEEKQNVYESAVDDKMYLATGLKCTPGGRITANAGTSYEETTLWNCFIASPVASGDFEYETEVPNTDEEIKSLIEGDQTPDNLTNIFLSLLEAAETLKSEGGYGINFGFIRPRGELIKGVGIRHPGVVSYMDMWDRMSEIIVKGDNDGYEDKLENYLDDQEVIDHAEKAMPRKGAMLAALPVWHPDIEEYVRAKQEKGRLTKFNISVLIDDKFMEAVENDDLYELHFDGKTYKKIKARELYNLIMECTYNRNEPGVLFFDNANRQNPLLYLGPVSASNPCLAEGTKVATENGLVPVEDISEGDKIQTTLGFDPVEEIEIHADCPVYKVEFSDGTSLRATEDHIFHVMQGSECRKTWDNTTRLKDIEAGDFVRKQPYRFETNNRTDLTRNDGFLAGYWLGDGCRNEKMRFILSANSSEDNQWLREALEEQGFTYHEDHSSEGDEMHFRVQNENDVSGFIEKVGLDLGKYSHEKSIPEWWVNTNRDFLGGVLDGLLSADGNINLSSRYPSVRFKTSSEDLASGFRELCLLVGADTKRYLAHEAGEEREIYGRKVVRKHDTYEIHLTNDCIESLYRFTGGLSHPSKDGDLREIVTSKQLTGTRWKVKIESIEENGTATVYDLYEPKADDWNTHGIVSRGCGEITGSSFMDRGYEPMDYLEPYLDGEDHHIGFTTVCLLGSINLTRFVNEDRTFDFEAYEEAIENFARMLENINDIDMAPLPIYRWAIENIRQYGMGINGLGSCLYMMGKEYGSEEAIEFTEKVNKIKDNTTLKISALLAEERDPFPMYSEEYLETPYFKEDCKADEEIKDLVREHGVRNAKRLTNPPLGSSSVICDNVSNGIEPVFAKEYERTVIADNWPEGLNKDNVKDILNEIEVGDATAWRGEYKGRTWYYEPHNRGICFVEPVRDYGYEWLKENHPGEIDKDYVVTSGQLSIDAHVQMQSAVQKYCEQAVSKCLVEGQVINTNQGLLPIEKCLEEEPQEEGFVEAKEGLKVYAEGGSLVDVKKAYYGGVKPSFRIRTRHGSVVESSENHRFKTPEGWVKASDLREGDYILTSEATYQHGEGGAELSFNPEKLGLRYYKEVTIPSSMSEELAELLGMVAADGQIRYRSFGLTEKDDTVGERFSELCETLFDRTPGVTEDKRNGVKTHKICSTPLAAFVKDLLRGDDSFTKQVPFTVLNGSRSEKLAFMSGVTLDGYAKRDRHDFALYAGVSEKLARQLVRMGRQVWGNGIRFSTKDSPTGNTVYVVRTYDVEGLNPPEDHKHEVLSDVQESNDLVLINPEDIEGLEYDYKDADYHSYRSLRRRMPMFVYKSVAQRHGLSYQEGVFVSSVEDIGNHPVYDIEVDSEDHTYLVEGLISHNTCNLEEDYPFDDFKRLYKEAWENDLVGFTTYREGTMENVLAKSDDEDDGVYASSLLDLLRKRNHIPEDAEVTQDDVIVRDIDLPDEFSNGPTRKVRGDGNKYYIHMSYLPGDDEFPVAIWVHSNSLEDKEYVSLNRAVRSVTKLLIDKGVDMDLVLDQKDKIQNDPHHVRLGKMLSMSLRHNLPLSEIVHALEGIEGDYVASTLSAVRKFLTEHIQDGTEVKGATCSECGSENLIYESGCDKCLDCGESTCK